MVDGIPLQLNHIHCCGWRKALGLLLWRGGEGGAGRGWGIILSGTFKVMYHMSQTAFLLTHWGPLLRVERMLPVAKDCSAPLTTSINLLDGMCLSGEKDSLNKLRRQGRSRKM